jgi:D-threo-aldose 1-dehydrogenase
MIQWSLNEFGNTGLMVTPVCIGAGAFGGRRADGQVIPVDRTLDTIRRAFRGPFNFMDTSNEYGDSELRIGEVIAEIGKLPDGFVLATKVDPAPGSTDFSGSRVRRSVEESLGRLGVDRLEIVYLHDPERIPFAEATGPSGAVAALVGMREEGLIGHLGVAGGSVRLELEYLATGLFDAALLHNRYTLLDQSAEPLLLRSTATGTAFVNAAPFGGGAGILARGPEGVSDYAYGPASIGLVHRAREIARLCRRFDVPLAAAALQFSLHDPRVTSTIVGMSQPSRIDDTVAAASHPIPEELWEEIAALDGRHGTDPK